MIKSELSIAEINELTLPELTLYFEDKEVAWTWEGAYERAVLLMSLTPEQELELLRRQFAAR